MIAAGIAASRARLPHSVEAEFGAELLERRWFGAMTALRNLQAECDVLLGVLQLAQEAWLSTRAQIAELEALRDALGERLADMDAPRPESSASVKPRPTEVMSAA